MGCSTARQQYNDSADRPCAAPLAPLNANAEPDVPAVLCAEEFFDRASRYTRMVWQCESFLVECSLHGADEVQVGRTTVYYTLKYSYAWIDQNHVLDQFDLSPVLDVLPK